jgi:hypothetical protein
MLACAAQPIVRFANYPIETYEPVGFRPEAIVARNADIGSTRTVSVIPMPSTGIQGCVLNLERQILSRSCQCNDTGIQDCVNKRVSQLDSSIYASLRTGMTEILESSRCDDSLALPLVLE